MAPMRVALLLTRSEFVGDEFTPDVAWNLARHHDVESPRVPWRLPMLRGWSHGKDAQVPAGSARARGEVGGRAARLARLGVVGDHVDRWEDRLHAGDAAEVGAAVQRDAGKAPGLATGERERLKELGREVRELKRANEILRKASAFFAQAELDRRPR